MGNYPIQQMPVYISYLQASTKAGQHQNPIRESFAQLIVERRVKRLPNLTYVSFKIPLLVTMQACHLCVKDFDMLTEGFSTSKDLLAFVVSNNSISGSPSSSFCSE